jgi:hypothetical protein
MFSNSDVTGLTFRKLLLFPSRGWQQACGAILQQQVNKIQAGGGNIEKKKMKQKQRRGRMQSKGSSRIQVLVAHSGMHPMLDAVEQNLDVCGDGLQLLEDYKFCTSPFLISLQQKVEFCSQGLSFLQTERKRIL